MEKIILTTEDFLATLTGEFPQKFFRGDMLFLEGGWDHR